MANKFVFVPREFRNIYEWQEESYRTFKVEDLKKYHTRLKKFNKTIRGQQFLGYKKQLLRRIHGLEVWIVDGNKLRSGVKAGDVDFTMGGHAYRYLYIPQYEIWIDDAYEKTEDLEWIIWHEYIERLLMLQGKDYYEAHTYASKLEIVQRKGDHWVLPVGTYRQAVPWSCGPAALKIVMDFLRWPVSEEYLAKLCKTTRKKGTNVKDLLEVARKMNFVAEERQKLTINEVKGLIREGTPIIANYQFEPEFGEGHYAVIIGFSKDEFILSDPSENKGYVRVKVKDFMDQWYELEDKTVRQGLIVRVG